ncbi:MAG: transglycosylase SLT domain-containing protein [Gemmatimonadaceae bacterium]
MRRIARSPFLLVALALLAPRVHAQVPADSEALDSILTHTAVSVVSTGEVVSDSVRLITSLLRANGASESRARVVAAAVVRHARSQSIDPLLLVGVIGVENPQLDIRARAHDGSVGVMQVQPFWRKQIKGCGDDLRNADVNVCYGTRILRMAIDSSDSLTEALRRYNGCRGKSERCARYTNAVFSRAGRALLLARSSQAGAR